MLKWYQVYVNNKKKTFFHKSIQNAKKNLSLQHSILTVLTL